VVNDPVMMGAEQDQIVDVSGLPFFTRMEVPALK